MANKKEKPPVQELIERMLLAMHGTQASAEDVVFALLSLAAGEAVKRGVYEDADAFGNAAADFYAASIERLTVNVSSKVMH